LFSFLSLTANAQLCQGSLGDPVVNITFGSGANPGPALDFPTGYGYVTQDCPNDGFYAVRNNTSNCFNDSWHTLAKDHTGDANGYFMLVNASLFPGTFYADTVRGLCSNTTFEFAAWVVNVLKPSACQGNGLKPNLTFTIETTDGSTILQTFNSGDIFADNTPQWKQYGFFFQTPANVSDVVVRIKNNQTGGCGNDLALDDITFRPCGPTVKAVINGENTISEKNICDYDTKSYTLNGSISAGFSNPAYQWQVSTDNVNWTDIPGATSPSFVRTPTTKGTYYYRISSAELENIGSIKCRVASNVIKFVVEGRPTTSVSNNSPICEGASLTLTATGGSTYAWTGPNNFSSSLNPAGINNASKAAKGKYYVVVTSATGCKNTDSTTVALYDKPITQFTVSSPKCENGIVQFTDASTAANGQTIITRSWSFGDGVTDVTANPSHVFATAKTYPVTLITATDKSCSDTLTQQVVIHYLPEPDFTLPEVCLSDPFAAFTNTSSIADNSSAQFTYLWNFGDANASPGNPNTSTQKDPQHSYTSVGVYNVQLKVTSKDGCIRDTTKSFTVNGALPLAKFTIENPTPLCSNNDVVITNNSTVNFGNITKVDIYWDYQNNATNKITDETPANGKQYNYRYADFGNPPTKNFTIKYVAYSGINCVNEATQIISLNASPKVQFNTMSAVCSNADPFIITQANEINGIGGTAVFSGSGVASNGLFNPQVAGEGLHNITYTFTATNGCMDTASQTINVYPQPTANAGPDRTLLEGGFLIINATASGNNTTYLWTPNTAIENNTVITPKIYPVNDITYTLSVTSADGCVSKDDVYVRILKTPKIPNAFSPNGDGINDKWIINYIESYPGVAIQVYNRYGQTVYHSINYNKPWDGTLNGSPLPVGTYYYIIDRKIAAPKLTGWVTILR